MTENNGVWLIEWLTGWMSEWPRLSMSVHGWVTGWLDWYLSDWMGEWLKSFGLLNGFGLTGVAWLGRVIGWLTSNCLGGLKYGCLVDWVTDWSCWLGQVVVGGLTGWLENWVTGWLGGWRISGWVVVRLWWRVGCQVVVSGWLHGWLVVVGWISANGGGVVRLWWAGECQVVESALLGGWLWRAGGCLAGWLGITDSDAPCFGSTRPIWCYSDTVLVFPPPLMRMYGLSALEAPRVYIAPGTT